MSVETRDQTSEKRLLTSAELDEVNGGFWAEEILICLYGIDPSGATPAWAVLQETINTIMVNIGSSLSGVAREAS